jgi:hypothetical protein
MYGKCDILNSNPSTNKKKEKEILQRISRKEHQQMKVHSHYAKIIKNISISKILHLSTPDHQVKFYEIKIK